MKNILLAITVLFMLSACSNKSDLKSDPEERLIPVYNNSILSDTAKTAVADAEPVKPVQRNHKAVIKHSANDEVAVKRTPAPVYIPETIPSASVETPPVVTAPAPSTTQSNTPVSNGTNASPVGVGSSDNTTASTLPQPEKKKGWSKAAKGTVIGAGVGAIGGAVLSKKKGLGAIVGGVVGAAGGYIIGKGMDKKDNRLTED